MIIVDRIIDYFVNRKLYHSLNKHAWSKGFQNWQSLVAWWCDKGWRNDPKGEILNASLD